jgi:hypothetical protein
LHANGVFEVDSFFLATDRRPYLWSKVLKVKDSKSNDFDFVFALQLLDLSTL